MLLEFRMKNYKSFKDECVFSMKSCPSRKGWTTVSSQRRSGRNDHKALELGSCWSQCLGKTNIIGAMETFRGSCCAAANTEVKNSPNAASSRAQVDSNNTLDAAGKRFSVIFTDP